MTQTTSPSNPEEKKEIKWKTWQGHEMTTTISTKDDGQYSGGGKLEHPVAEVTGNKDYKSDK